MLQLNEDKLPVDLYSNIHRSEASTNVILFQKKRILKEFAVFMRLVFNLLESSPFDINLNLLEQIKTLK